MDAADPAAERGLTEVVLAHHLGAGLAEARQRDYLPPELLGELPGCFGSRMDLPSSKGPQTLIRLSK